MTPRILVTGGAGLIGSHIADELLAAGYEVTILDNLEPEVHPEGAPDWLPTAARFVHGDVRDPAPANPQTVYGGSKYFQARLTLGMGRELGIGAVALRYFLTFGPRQSVHNPYSGICSIFSTRILNRLPATVYEDAKQSRDMVFV